MNTVSNTVERGERKPLDETDRHDLLAHETRRGALEVLTTISTPIDLDVLAAEIAVRESRRNAADRESIERVAITLHHQHLPKMDDIGVIAYDADAKTIAAYEGLDDLTD